MIKELINKMKSASFWMSLGGAVVMVLQCLGVKISAPYVNEIISAVCSVFVIMGIMTPAKKEEETQPENTCPALENEENDHSSESDPVITGEEGNEKAEK